MLQNKVKLTRTACQHASDAMLSIPELAEILDQSMGFVFEAEGHKKVYVLEILYGMNMLKQKLLNINLIIAY